MDKLDKLDMLMNDILGFENEYEMLSKQARTPEEIEKWCTKEDLPEVKRLVHLMKKGYEIQKISVVNNLDRYMQEAGANEELFSLIIDSLVDWDDKMQKECAYSFIKPLELDLINKRNKEKVVKAAVQITTDDDNAENTELLDCWIKVLETVVSRVDLKFITENVINVIKDIPSLKNPFAKRKRGNRLVFAVAKNLGEDAFDKEPQIIKLVLSICQDNNYKIRRDGVIFLKEYFKHDRKKIIEHDRFKDVYLPELIDFLNDEDLHIQIDAIDAVAEILEELDLEEIENDFVPCFLQFMDIESQSQIEIVKRVAEMFGQVLFKLSKVGLHLKYKEQFVTFYKELCEHEDDAIRQMAVFNLPCMNMLYKSVEQEIKISFQRLWLKFSEDENTEIKQCAAKSIHEAFKLVEDDEDIQYLQKCFLNLILDDNREIILIMNENLSIMIKKYGNAHTIQNFKGRTPYIESANCENGNQGKNGKNSKESTPKDSTPNSKKSNGATKADDFSSAVIQTKKHALQKKNTHLGIPSSYDDYLSEEAPKLPPIYTTDEYQSELVYSDLLQRLMVYINNVKSHSGLWREHAKLIKNLCDTIHLFYMPEIHTYLVQMLFEFLQKGNRDIKEAACNCLAIILQYQHYSPSREDLLEMVKNELTYANNWIQRKTFIYFCRYIVQYVPSEFFKIHFMKDYLACSQDKVPHVRMEFANAMLIIKPYFDKDVDLSLELMDILNKLQNDQDRDVLEAVEHTDYELLQQRKKKKDTKDDKLDQGRIEFQKALLVREKQEIEERKKRVDDEEESKYDMASFLAESKKWRQKATKISHYNRRPIGSMTNSKTQINSGSNSKNNITKSGGDSFQDLKTQLVKKKTMKIPKTSGTNLTNELDFQKQRKNSIIIGGTKDDQIKRYHQMVSGQNGAVNGQSQRQSSNSTKEVIKPSGGGIMNSSQSMSQSQGQGQGGKPLRRNTDKINNVQNSSSNTNGYYL